EQLSESPSYDLVVVEQEDPRRFAGIPHLVLRVESSCVVAPSEVTGDERLSRLLDAVLTIASDLSLPVVLRRIVESACELVDARYGALGVLGADSTLSDFVTVGVTPETHRRI